MKEPETLLGEILIERQMQNPHYSMRAFARDIGINQGMLSRIIGGKHRLTLKQALRISSLDPQLKKLETLVINAAKQKQISELVSDRKNKFHAKKIQILDVDVFKLLGEWYHLAILELTTTQNFQNYIPWIAKRLNIGTPQAAQAIDRLKRLSLLTEENGTLKKSMLLMNVLTRSSTASIRIFHTQMMKKAIEELGNHDQESFDNRLISGMTLAVDAAQVEDAKKTIEKFKKSFLKKYTAQNSNEVYQVNVQFFPLSKTRRSPHVR